MRVKKKKFRAETHPVHKATKTLFMASPVFLKTESQPPPRTPQALNRETKVEPRWQD